MKAVIFFAVAIVFFAAVPAAPAAPTAQAQEDPCHVYETDSTTWRTPQYKSAIADKTIIAICPEGTVVTMVFDYVIDVTIYINDDTFNIIIVESSMGTFFTIDTDGERGYPFDLQVLFKF